MDKKITLKYHKKNAIALNKLEINLNESFQELQKFVGFKGAHKILKTQKLQKLLIEIRNAGDILILHTNPEAEDNIKWYYGKFKEEENEI